MAQETFADRLNRLVDAAGMTEADLASVLRVSETQARRILSGYTSTLKLDAALRLCRRLKVSPWYLQGIRPPSGTTDDDVSGTPDVTEPQGDLLLSATLDQHALDVYLRLSGKPPSKVAMASIGVRVRSALEEINAQILYANEEASIESEGAVSWPDASAKSTSFRLQKLEEQAADSVTFGRQVSGVSKALSVLLSAEVLPQTLRNEIRDALSQAREGPS